ncbi:MAG: glycyl radical protein [Bacteroidales bacterium]
MNKRIQKLREESLKAVNCISAERALLVTEFYKHHKNLEGSVPVQRAKAFEYILNKKYICINDGELIVGERGPAPKATPTYPEINLHTLEDLDTLNDRPKVSFKVDEKTRKTYEEVIIPYWKGRTQRERIFSQVDQSWIDAYNAGVYTEFQEQRAPGHTVAGKKAFQKGMLDIIEDIHNSINRLDFLNDKEAQEKRQELKAMEIAARTIIHYAERHSEKLKEMARHSDDHRKNEYLKMAKICQRVPAHAPETFHEALQHYWFIHLGVVTELNPWDSFNPGRLDQHLYPFFKKELEEGTLNKEQAKELLEAFWIKFNNHPSPPKVGVTAQESNTYTDFALINLGGVDERGQDATNELTYLILDVIEEMRILQPSSMVQISKKTPDRLVKRTAHITKTGFGQPSYFNTEAIIKELLRQGKEIEDARNGGASGCVETGAFGKESYILTGYFNLNKIFEITLYNGIDPVSGKEIGIKTGKPETFKSFDEFFEAFNRQLNNFTEIKLKGNNIIESLYAKFMPVPFLSLIIDDCITNGKDYNAGGTKYNTSYVQGVGLGSLTDNLTSIKYNVFDKKKVSMKDLLQALENNFTNHEKLRYDLIYNTPKYGNDDDYADENTTKIFEAFYESINGKPTARGGIFRINLLPTTSHVYFGSVINAMPDGRKAGTPLSEGISPVQGADRKGPTAVIKTVAKIDHIKTGGTLLNQKFSPSFFNDEEGIEKFTRLIRSYFRMDGHHIQFNVINAETLKKAQKEPEKYEDLIVRVAGYSDYFNDLGEDLQNEIIKRTEHETM